MNLKTKNKIKTIALLSLSAVMVAAGSFAFFSDKKESKQTAKVGTLELEYGSNIAHQNGLNNINPGDNDKSVPKDNRPGTDHELLIRTKNTGTKSAVVKHIIKVTATKNGHPIELISDEGRRLLLFTPTEKENLDTIGDTSVSKQNRGMGNADPINFKFNNDFTSMYYVSPEYPLNGTEELDAQKDTIAKVYDLGLSRFAENEFAGAEINIEIQTLAMQYRNTGKSEWTNIFKDELTIKQDPIPGEDEKPDKPSKKPEMVDEETAETVDTSYAYAKDERFRRFAYTKVFVDKNYNVLPQDKVSIIYVKSGEDPYTSDNKKSIDYDIENDNNEYINVNIKRDESVDYELYVKLKTLDGKPNYVPVQYKKTYQLDMRITGLRIGRNYLRLKSQRANTNVKLIFWKNGEVAHTETVIITKPNEYQKFILKDNYKMEKDTEVEIEGLCKENGKTYTTNPWTEPIY